MVTESSESEALFFHSLELLTPWERAGKEQPYRCEGSRSGRQPHRSSQGQYFEDDASSGWQCVQKKPAPSGSSC